MKVHHWRLHNPGTKVGRITPCAPSGSLQIRCGAHGVMRPTFERSRRSTERGSAVVIVLILAGIMGMLISENGRALHGLKQEIQLLEQKQLRQHEERRKRQPQPINKPDQPGEKPSKDGEPKP